MIQQTLIWTALPQRSASPLGAGTRLRLSVFVAPRLWNDDPAVKMMKLSDFPDFLDWPQRIGQATFQVAFEGGPTLAATPDLTSLRSDLWQALFNAETDVRPFEFKDLSGVPVLSIPAATLHDLIRGTYQRVATDPRYGGGAQLPARDQLAANPDLRGIARPVSPEPPYDSGDANRGPVVIGTPGPPPGPGPAPGCSGCLGCLLLPWSWLRAALRRLRLLFSLLPLAVLGGVQPVGFGGGALQPPPPAGGTGNPAPPSGGPGNPAAPAGGSGGTGAPPPPAGGGPPNPREAFDRLRAYLQPASKLPGALPTLAAVRDTYDFHQMIAALGDYPLLLPRLGLVVDLAVTLPAALPAGTGTVKVAANLPLATPTTHYFPRTHYVLDAQRFVAQPRPQQPEIRNGLLRLDDTQRFRVIQLDLAGSGIKLQNAATSLAGQEELATLSPNSPQEAGLPALQTAGVSVVRVDKALEVRDAFLRAYALNTKLAQAGGAPLPPPPAAGGPPPPLTDELFAEDVKRGYRIDVFDDQSQAWHSLCRRIGTYRFLAAPGGAVALVDQHDEGFVQLAATEPLPGTAELTLRVHESLFTWAGWSLCAPRPGKTILPDQTIGPATNVAVTNFKLETGFAAVPQSLPRLRFGYRYRLRARTVDLAGRSVFDPGDQAFDETPAEATPEFMFQRFEPISPPALLLREVPKEGESLEQLVVRSAVGETPQAIATRTSERHVAPPKTAQLMAERHRKFDGVPGMLQDPATYDLASREAGSITAELDTATGTLKLIPGVKEVPDPQDSQHTYWLQTNPQFELAYLPDPYARGVLLLGLPGMAAFDEIVEPGAGVVPVNKIPFDGDWPKLEPLRLQLAGLPAGATPSRPAWDAGQRLLQVQLAQAETAQVRISSYLHAGNLERMAVWGWTVEAAPLDLASLEQLAVAGRSWLQLPYRTLVLVHAVQQPLAIPKLTAFAAGKQLGGTSAALTGKIDLDGKSTGKVEVRAAWQDPVDDPTQPTFGLVSHEMHVAEVLVHDPKDDQVVIDAAHAFGDTNYHSVTYSPVATTRFREYFPTQVTGDAKNLVRPRPGEIGTPQAVAAQKILDIANSARPAAPRPLYLLPAWERSANRSGPVTTHVRHGGGLRVYLERPWFSSGAGELLGVVVRPDAAPVDGDAGETLRKFTSEWGMDPIRAGAPTKLLALADLKSPKNTGLSLSLDELPGTPVHVAGYAPEFDADRQLWYCEVTLAGAEHYFPFVRLALARFQPISVNDAHLSRVVLADFAQVVPDRQVDYDLSRLPANAAVDIKVSGPTYITPGSEGQGLQATTIMVARLEQRPFAQPDDDIGWEPIALSALTPSPLTVTQAVWRGSLGPVPSGAAPGTLRATVLEVEAFQADPGAASDFLSLIDPQAAAAGASRKAPELELGGGYRVVFADALNLS